MTFRPKRFFRFSRSVLFPQRFPAASVLLTVILFLGCDSPCFSQTKRLVSIKCDGLPYETVDRFVHERDPRTGKSQLPWIEYIFYQRGSRLANFYVRGLSLSAPSWSLLDTGQHLQIKGNVEFDRYTPHTYDYLNFIPFYVSATIGPRVDMPGVEVLDSIGVPLLIDAYSNSERATSFSLFQRGPRYLTFQKAMENKFKRPPKELFDEWTMGFELTSSVPEQSVRELIENLSDSRIRYFEYVTTNFDHTAHHNNDRESHLFALKELDSMLGRIWTAIQKSPLAAETALVLVSDHGINSDERIYSQGYNLVKLLGSVAGGGHHVVTKRRLLLDYSIKGMNPFVQVITTTTRDSYYLRNQSTDYPTALLDFDGNERASVHLRDSDLNLLQIVLQQLQRTAISPALTKALTDLFFKTLDKRRTDWQQTLQDLHEELGALTRTIERLRKLAAAQPKKFTKEDREAGRDDASKRVLAQLDIRNTEQKDYTEYARTLGNLLALRKENFTPVKLKIGDLIARRSMGDLNSVHQLQNYIVGVAPSGFVLNPDGSLDIQKSFAHVNYFSLFHGLSVRNNVQAGVGNRPIDLIAMRLASDLVKPLIDDVRLASDVIWVYGGPERQVLILSREDEQARLSFRYQPVKNLRQDEDGRLHFEIAPWQPGLPLKIFEDKKFAVALGDRKVWLSEWHTDLEWLRALHNTEYSNGLIGLHEQLARHLIGKLSADDMEVSSDERLMRRFLRRERVNIEADLLLVANNHWNFDVRGFNPGGNHGSFFRVSTHSTFMLAGGDKTEIPRRLVVDEPYDSLSFVPTLLALTGNLRDDSNPIPVLFNKGFRRFPGRVVSEVLPGKPEKQNIAVTGATSSP